MNYRKIHDDYVQLYIKKFGGESFKAAPFDVIDAEGRFVEIKVVNKNQRRHRLNSVLTLSKEEFKFALRKEVWFIFIVNGYVFFFPFSDIKERFLRVSWCKGTPGKYGERHVKRIYVPLRFLKGRIIEDNLGIKTRPLEEVFPERSHEVICKQCCEKFLIDDSQDNRKFCSWKCWKEWKKQNGSWAKGKKFSQEHRQKISNTRKLLFREGTLTPWNKKQGSLVKQILDKI